MASMASKKMNMILNVFLIKQNYSIKFEKEEAKNKLLFKKISTIFILTVILLRIFSSLGDIINFFDSLMMILSQLKVWETLSMER